MGILSGSPQKEPMHYGEVFAVWSHLMGAQAMIPGFQTLKNHTGDDDLKDLLDDMIANARSDVKQMQELLKHNGKDIISVLDAGRLNDNTRRLGKMVKYLICAKDFAEAFSNTTLSADDIEGLTKCHKELVEYFDTNVIITLEARGSFTFIDGNYEVIPSVKVKALDSTGAGDIFHGAFTYFISNGYSLRDSIKYSSITSAISVTRIGARFSIPELEEVLEYDNLI